MDLHDYKDVAENYDRYLEVMYTEGQDNHEGFQEFYYDLAKKYGVGGVVDIACGTGAVLLYLAERGIDVDGTDLSAEMCKVADAKAHAKGLKLNICPADMTKFSSGRKVRRGSPLNASLIATVIWLDSSPTVLQIR